MKVWKIIEQDPFNKEVYKFIENKIYLNKEDAEKYKKYLDWNNKQRSRYNLTIVKIIEFEANIF